MIRTIDSFVFVWLPVFAASSILLKRILNLKGTHLFSNSLMRLCSLGISLLISSFSSFLDKMEDYPFIFESPSNPIERKIFIQLTTNAG